MNGETFGSIEDAWGAPSAESIARHWPDGADRSPETMARLREVLSTIEAVEKRRDRAALVQRTACTHCGAAGGEPCRKPDGSPYVQREPWRTNMFTSEWTTPRFHAARQSAAVALFNSAMPDSWRADLRSSPSAIATVEREVRASALYQTMEAA